MEAISTPAKPISVLLYCTMLVICSITAPVYCCYRNVQCLVRIVGQFFSLYKVTPGVGHKTTTMCVTPPSWLSFIYTMLSVVECD